jgi:hypothetical protein
VKEKELLKKEYNSLVCAKIMICDFRPTPTKASAAWWVLLFILQKIPLRGFLVFSTLFRG